MNPEVFLNLKWKKIEGGLKDEIYSQLELTVIFCDVVESCSEKAQYARWNDITDDIEFACPQHCEAVC